MQMKARQRKMIVSALLFCLAGAGPVAAGQAVQSKTEEPTQIQVADQVMVVQGRMSLGYLTNEATELSYLPESGYKVSELKWESDEVLMLGLGGSVQPKRWLRFNADVQFKVTDGENTMDDYDWLLPGADWTDWSHHEEVDLTTGYIVDLNAEFPLLHVGADPASSTSFSFFAGFKTEEWEWEASNGSYIYSENGFRDISGTFTDGLEISYNQQFDTPYIGVGFTSHLTNLDLHGRIIGSMLVQGEDRDQHHMRNLIFESEFDNGDMLGIDFGLAYRFAPQWAVTADFQFLEYSENKGSMDITDLRTGARYHFEGDASGIDHSRSTWMLGIRYQF